MKAVLCTQFGGPETLQVADIDSPAAGPGDNGDTGSTGFGTGAAASLMD